MTQRLSRETDLEVMPSGVARFKVSVTRRARLAALFASAAAKVARMDSGETSGRAPS